MLSEEIARSHPKLWSLFQSQLTEVIQKRCAELHLAFPMLNNDQVRRLYLAELKGVAPPMDVQCAVLYVKPEYPLAVYTPPVLTPVLNTVSTLNHPLSTTPPVSFNPSFAKIPISLKVLRRWAVWIRSADCRKIPYVCPGGRLQVNRDGEYKRAKSNDPQTWHTFQEAVQCMEDYPRVAGLSFALGDGYIGFDFDNVRDLNTGLFHPHARDWILCVGGYCEVSDSQQGAKSITRGVLSREFLATAETGRQFKGIPDTGMAVEVYHTRRFFSLTGLRLKGFDEIDENQEGVDTVCKILLDIKSQRDVEKHPNAGRKNSVKEQSLPLSDEAVLAKIRASRQAHKFNALWRGDLTGYDSPSEADMALISILKFWCDDEQLERLFSQSELGNRDKWVDRSDYRERTIQNAITTEKYQPRRLPLRFKEAAERASAILGGEDDDE